MNQISNIPPQRRLYIFDFDNTLIRHQDGCMNRVPVIAGAVVNAHTGIDNAMGGDMAVKSFFANGGDGFAVFKKDHGERAYWGMHRTFNALTAFDKTADYDTQLPQMINDLSKYGDVCVASHCTQIELEMAMTRLGYNPCFIAHHVFGLERLGGFKSDSESGVYERLCERYGVILQDSVLIEDSQANIDCANALGVGRAVLIDNTNTAFDFIQSEIKQFEITQRTPTCLPA